VARLLAALTSTTPCNPLKTTCSRLRKNRFTLVSTGRWRKQKGTGGCEHVGTGNEAELCHITPPAPSA
jgi:hypothetical protein